MSHVIAPISLDGWYVLHQFFRIAPVDAAVDDLAPRRERADEVAGLLASWEDLGEDGWSGVYRVVGGGVDVMVVHFRPTLEALGEAERALRIADSAMDLIPAGDFVSVVELGLYHHTAALLQRAEQEDVEPFSETWQAWVEEALEQESQKAYVKRRLHPRQPDEMPHICFYPMDKRRNPGQNWYRLPVAERAGLMMAHGATGRRWAGRVSQIITGSVGFDDWEWGVTLFAADPLEFKALVTEMRYDEATSIYGEFGSFWVGHRGPTEALAEELVPA